MAAVGEKEGNDGRRTGVQETRRQESRKPTGD